MEVDGSHAPPLPPGTESGSRHPDRSAGAGVRGWRGQTQALPGSGRGGEREPAENEGVSDVVPPSLPERAAPGSQDTRRAAEYVARMRYHSGFTQS